MFLRIETGFKAEFSDPEANRLQHKIAEIHPSLAEKVRWVRKLKVYWLELHAPRDKVVQAVQIAFKNPVTNWLFTGDLLPSAAGSTGTLYDLMQESPFRPGIFHGIEKRTRLQVHDEEAVVTLDALQTILGRKLPQDRVVSGEILLLEGIRLNQSDLEWIARNWFTREKFESWSLLSEDELKRNSRFQSEQVAKYLGSSHHQGASRLLQFRQNLQPAKNVQNWDHVNECFKSSMPMSEICETMVDEEWQVRAEVQFASRGLQIDTKTEVEFNLVKQQLDAVAKGCDSKLQTILSVLPDKNRLWISEVYTETQGEHPIRVRSEFEGALKRVAETTATPIVQMKCYEDPHENDPTFFWSSSVSIGEIPNAEQKTQGNLVDLLWIGFDQPPAYTNLTFVQLMKDALKHAKKGDVIDFALPTSGKTLLDVLKNSETSLLYGFDLVVDGMLDWFNTYLAKPFPISQIWGVHLEKKDWVISELRSRNIPFLHFGTSSLTGDVRVIESGVARVQLKIAEFFKKGSQSMSDDLAPEAFFVQESRLQPAKFKNRYSVEELLLKPETYHVNVPSPVVIRPKLSSWAGLMVLSDLCGVEFNAQYMEYLMRKCTALGGQIHSLQISMLNGLQDWLTTVESLKGQYGILLSQLEIKSDPEIQSHWLALQLVSKVSDVRTVRSEDFKYAQDRIYWLAGSFEEPATRWLAGIEGRYQSGLHSAVAIEGSNGTQSVIDTLIFALLKRKLGAEIKISGRLQNGFFVSVSENERFGVEEEWRTIGVEFQFVGRVTSSPFLVIRSEDDQVQTISIEDLG